MTFTTELKTIFLQRGCKVFVESYFTPLSTVFQSYHGDRSHYSCLSWVSPVDLLGWALKCLARGHSYEKNQRIQCGSNPGPLDYKSNTLPLGRAGPCKVFVFHARQIMMFSSRVRIPLE